MWDHNTEILRRKDWSEDASKSILRDCDTDTFSQ